MNEFVPAKRLMGADGHGRKLERLPFFDVLVDVRRKLPIPDKRKEIKEERIYDIYMQCLIYI